MEDKAVTLFRNYVCLKTVQPDPDYGLLYSLPSLFKKNY